MLFAGLLIAPAAHADQTVSVVSESARPEIHPPSVVGIRSGTPFLWSVPVSGARPMAFSVKGLPAGLRMDRATGIITGRIMRAGDYPVKIHVTNSVGADSGTVHLVAGDRVALTPPMGWNSYDGFGDNVKESEVLDNARYMAKYLQPYGWNMVVVDFRWYDPGAFNNYPNSRAGVPLTMDRYGRLLPSPNRFPSAGMGKGFKGVADQVHAMGLQFGIHVMRGIPRNAVAANTPIEDSSYSAPDAADKSSICTWNPDMYGVRSDTPAGQAYYDSLLRLYASWDVDFIKVDDIARPYHIAEIEAIRKAIDKCGRSITLSLSPGATPVAQAAHVAAHANMWREADDFWDRWKLLNNEFDLGAAWHDAVGPGHWPDADMLPLGHLSISGRSVGKDRNTRLTKDEQVTLLTLWSLLPSPLMVGANLPDNDPWTLSLLTNPEVLAVDQDASGAAAKLVSSHDSAQVWEKRLADGRLAVGLFNRGDLPAEVTANWADLGINGSYVVRDAWERMDIGNYETSFSAPLAAHGARLLILHPR